MVSNNEKERFFHVYEQLFQYKEMLKGAPALTINIKQLSPENTDSVLPQVQQELKAMTAYLLGLRGEHLPVNVLLDALNKHYKKDDFWRKLLLDYIELIQEQAEEALAEQKKAVQEEGLSLYEKLREFQKRRKEIINSFVMKLAPQKFPINAERLFKNYMNMADLDAAKAWDTLINNPAAFSPIIVENDKEKRVLSVSAAKEMNKKIGNFIKKMKA